MTVAEVLPLAFVMIAGPQIISAFFFATTEKWSANSLAYIGGAAVAITAFTSVAYVVSNQASGGSSDGQSSSTDTTIDWIVLVLLVVLIVRVFATRKTSEPPKWMGRLQDASPRFCLVLGLLLLGVFPSDLLTSVTVGLHVGHRGDAWWQVLPFVGVTLLLLSLPAICVLVLGARAKTVLPRVRDWMNDNSWVVSEIVLLLFLGLTVNNLAG